MLIVGPVVVHLVGPLSGISLWGMHLYRARHPRQSPLWQCAHRHFAAFAQIYPQDYQRHFGPLRPVISQVVHKFLDCGNLDRGFARVRCDHCRHEYLLAFSCKTRCLSTLHGIYPQPKKPKNVLAARRQRRRIANNEPDAKAILPEPHSVPKANSYQYQYP